MAALEDREDIEAARLARQDPAPRISHQDLLRQLGLDADADAGA